MLEGFLRRRNAAPGIAREARLVWFRLDGSTPQVNRIIRACALSVQLTIAPARLHTSVSERDSSDQDQLRH